MAYVKIIFQNSPSTATPMNAQNLNHMDDQIALNDQRLTDLEGAHVSSFNGRTGAVTPADGDYDIGQIAPLTGAQVGQVPVVTNIGTEEDPKLVFRMGAGGGAGGHEIIDSDGNTMPQETAMQFPDSFVSDDETNGRTIVENIKEHTTASDYENATEDGIHVIDDGNDVPIGEIEEDVVSVTADGVKTFGTLLSEIFNNEKFDITKVTLNSKFTIGGTIYNALNISTTSVSFTYSSGSKSSPYLMNAIAMISATPSLFESRENTYHESINDKPANGTKITLYYGNKKAVVDLQTTANRCLLPDGETTVADVVDCDKTTAGTYALKCTVDAQGNKTYSWV